MRCANFAGEGRIDIAESDWPKIAPGEVLLRVLACSLCGSDLRPLRNGWPVTPGHEIAGRVDQPGHRLHSQRCLVYIPVFCGRCAQCAEGHTQLCETATDLMGWQRAGGYAEAQALLGHCQRCLVYIPVFCGRCAQCAEGHTQLCETATDLMGWQRAGGYAEALAVPEQCLLPVPDDVPTHLAPLLLDTIGTAAHGVRLSQMLVPKGRALVLGAGPIGLGALLVLQQFGYGPIDVVDPNQFRRGVAGELGATALSALDPQTRYPLVLECSGKDAARQAALEGVAARGVVVQLGEADAWHVNETKAIRRKDFYYVRSFYFPIAEYTLNIELLRADRARFERLVDARVPLEGLQELFAQFARGERLKPQLSLASQDRGDIQ